MREAIIGGLLLVLGGGAIYWLAAYDAGQIAQCYASECDWGTPVLIAGECLCLERAR